MFSTSGDAAAAAPNSRPQNASKRKLAGRRVTEISWTGTGEEQLQEALGLELIKWCETPSPEDKAAEEGAGAAAAAAGGGAAAEDSSDNDNGNGNGNNDEGPIATSTQEDAPRRLSDSSQAVVVVSSNRYERVQAAAAHGMLASMTNVIGAGADRTPAIVQAANPPTGAEDVMMAKQPRYAQRKRPREVKDNHWLKISEELVMNIFGFLEQPDLGRACLVCQEWKRLAQDESLWRTMLVSGKRMSPEILHRAIVRNPRHLKVLDCDLVTYDPLGPEYFQVDPQLPTILGVRHLNLCTTRISDEDAAKLVGMMPELRSIEFGGNQIGSGTLLAIAGCKKLQCLSLKMVKGIEVEQFETMVQECKMLKVLDMGWTCNRSNFKRAGSRHCSTQDCTLPAGAQHGMCAAHFAVTRAIESIARNCGQLEHLDFSGCREYVNDGHVEMLVAGCTSLKTLDLSDSYTLTNAAATSIMKHLEQLEYLALSRCHRIEIALIKELANKDGLKCIQLFGCYPQIDEQLKDAKKHCEFNNNKLCQLRFNTFN